MKRFLTAFAVLVLIAPLGASAEVSTWTIDPAHSSAEFSVRHMMVSKVKGRFSKLSGTVVGDLSNPTSVKVDVVIDASSIDTHNTDRDNHLRSADFFEVDEHPTITFRSEKVERAGNGYRLLGELTMRGVTKHVVLDVEGPTAPVTVGPTRRAGASATTKVNRKDFGLTWNRAMEAGGVVVGDEVRIAIEVELVEQPPAE